MSNNRELKPMWALIGGAVGMVVVYGAIFWAASAKLDMPLGKELKPVQLPASVPVRLTTSQLRSGSLVALQVAGTQQVPVVVMRSAEGVVHAALASCRVCYGQHQRNELHEFGVLCARCRTGMKIPGPHDPEKKRSCDLVKLSYRQENGDVLISDSDLLEANRALEEANKSK